MTSGGRRPGAGRKALPPEKKMVQVSVTIWPDTKHKIGQLRRAACPVGRRLTSLVTKAVEEWAEEFEIKK